MEQRNIDRFEEYTKKQFELQFKKRGAKWGQPLILTVSPQNAPLMKKSPEAYGPRGFLD